MSPESTSLPPAGEASSRPTTLSISKALDLDIVCLGCVGGVGKERSGIGGREVVVVVLVVLVAVVWVLQAIGYALDCEGS